MAKQKTITFSELKRLSFCNSKKLPKTVNMFGKRWHWVGVGWVDEGKATGKEVKIIDDFQTSGSTEVGKSDKKDNGSKRKAS